MVTRLVLAVRAVKAVIVLSASALFGACATESNDAVVLYSIDQITDVLVEEPLSGKRLIRYRPLLESAYYSPGASVVFSNNEIRVGVVRCRIKSTCEVTVKASKDENGLSTIEIDHLNVGKIYLIDDQNSEQIYP